MAVRFSSLRNQHGLRTQSDRFLIFNRYRRAILIHSGSKMKRNSPGMSTSAKLTSLGRNSYKVLRSVETFSPGKSHCGKTLSGVEKSQGSGGRIKEDNQLISSRCRCRGKALNDHVTGCGTNPMQQNQIRAPSLIKTASGIDTKALSETSSTTACQAGPFTLTLAQEESSLFRLLLDFVEQTGIQTKLRASGGWVRDKLLNRNCCDIDIALDNMTGVEFATKLNK